MNRPINDIYTSIARYLNNCINESWSEILLEVERGSDDAIEFTGTYKSIDGELKYLDVWDLDDQVDDDFDEIYAIMTEENDHHKWNRAKFKLTPDGKFSIDFDWDQELFDEIARLNAE